MHVLPDSTMQALSWTLIHSLWQGLLLAIAGGLVILFTKKSSSALRYNLLSILFFLFVAAVAFTFVKQVQDGSDEIQFTRTLIRMDNGTGANLSTRLPSGNPSTKDYLGIFVNYFNQHASLVVMLWFILFSAQLVKLMANALYIQRIRNSKTHLPSRFWKRRLQELGKRLQINRRVQLLQSELVKAPVMVGFFKPVILFPFSLMSQLPPQQIEAVLLHELAHIKRKDYLVNLLQNVADIIFFFNPGVLWISSVIRDERENCCDDIAIEESKSKKEFVYALATFQEYNLSDSTYALSFPGRKNHILNRIKRIITNNNKTLNNMEKISLASCIVIIGLVILAFKPVTEKSPINRPAPDNEPVIGRMINDTVPDKQQITSTFNYSTTIDGKNYKIKEENNKVTDFEVEGKKVPEDQIKDYQEIIEKIHIQAKRQQEELKLQEARLQYQKTQLIGDDELMRKKADEMRAMMDQKNEQQAREQAFKEKMIENLYSEQAELAAKQDAIKRMMEEFDLKKSDLENKEGQGVQNKQNAELFSQLMDLRKEQEEFAQKKVLLDGKDSHDRATQKELAELDHERLNLNRKQDNINRMLADRTFEHNLLEPLGQPSIESDQLLNLVPNPPVSGIGKVEAIIADLLQERIITDPGDLSFTLNKKVFRVNGVNQPEEIHDRFKNEYIKGANGNHIIYSKHGGSTSTEAVINK
jgi:bla regulator protein BlaR1